MMLAPSRIRVYVLLCAIFAACALACLLPSATTLAQTASAAPAAAPPALQAAALRDGQHDFDFEIGAWKVHLKKLQHPLTGSTTWIEFDGTIVARPVWDGRANFDEFARPSQTGRATMVPSNSIQVVEPVRGCCSFFRWTFQAPISKSKSCWPSRSAAACRAGGAAAGAADAVCASVVAEGSKQASAHAAKIAQSRT